MNSRDVSNLLKVSEKYLHTHIVTSGKLTPNKATGEFDEAQVRAYAEKSKKKSLQALKRLIRAEEKLFQDS